MCPGQADVVAGTVETVGDGYDDIPVETDGSEIFSVVVCDKFIEPGIEINT